MATKKKKLFESIKQGAGGALSGHEKEWTAPAAPKRQTQGDGRGTGSQTTSAGRSSGTSSTENGLEILQAAQRQLGGTPYTPSASVPALNVPGGRTMTPQERVELVRATEERRKQKEKEAAAALGNDKIGEDILQRAQNALGVREPEPGSHGRIEHTLGAAGNSWLSGQLNMIGSVLGSGVETNSGAGLSAKVREKEIKEYREKMLGGLRDKSFAAADTRAEKAEKHEKAAKEGLGGFGKLVVDTSIAGSQMLMDAALGSVTGTGLLSMGTRTYGDSARQAREAGASWDQANRYGLGKAGVEVGTEKMFDAMRLFGGGSLDKTMEATLNKMAKTDAGRTALRLLGNIGGEGAEEAVSDLVDPILRQTYDSDAIRSSYGTAKGREEMRSQILYDALVGGILGGLGGAGSVVTGENARKNDALRTPEERDAMERPQRIAEADAARARQDRLFGADAESVAAYQAQQNRPRTIAQGVEALQNAANAVNAQNAAESLRTNGTAQEGNFTEKAETALGQTRTGQIGAEERIATAQAPRNDNAGEAFAAEDHIDNRTDDYIRKTGTKAFQHEHPELHDNFVAVATEMQALLHASVESDLPGKKGGTIAWYPEPIKKLVNGTGLSRPKLMGVLQDIIDNHGTENYADAKRVEKVLDELLTKGYEGYGRRRVPPDDTYLAKKDAINGAKDRNSFDAFMDENWMRTLEGDTEETLRAEWEAKQLKAQLEEQIGRPLTMADLDSMSNQELAERIRPAMEQTTPTDANGLPLGQGAASAGFDPYSAWQNESDSFHREGEKAARPVELPTENRDGLRTMKGGQTVMEAEQTPTERADQLAGVYVDGGLAYAPVKNAELAASAETKLERDGWEKTLRDWTADVRSGKLNNDIVAMGAVLINQAGNSGMDAKSYLDLASDYVVLTHRAGQALQASRILKNLTPSARLYMMQRSIYSIAEEAGIDDAEINPELAEKYMKAETDKERDAVIGEIQADIASRLKSTAMDKWTALRYTNMLGNFKTQVRNLTGNTIMGIEAAIRRRLDAVLHGGLHVMTGGKHQREVSAFYAPSLYSAAWSDFENVKSYAKGESKFSDINSPFQSNDFLRGINDKKRIFKFAPLEGYRKLTQRAMEAGDDIFIRLTYADAMAQYLNAHGVKDGAALRSGEVSEELLDAAREYAAREAQEATFHDTNAFSSWVSQIGRGKNTPKFVKTAVEGTLPFRKTPANVAVRGYEYSPLGVASSLLNTVNAINPNSETTANDAIRSWSKTMTGSALLVAGFTLARMGILRGKDDDDDKKAAFDHLRGHQEYSIEIGGKSYTIDAFAPSCMPLLVGAEAARLTRDNGWDVKNVESALANLTDPMINMSMLQGVNDTLDNIKFSDNSLIQLAELSIFNYLTQGTTNTLAGQLERTFEPTRMTTYTDPDSPLPAWMQKQIGKMSAKTPGWDYQQTEYLDSWGRTQSNGTLGQRAVRNLFAPWYTSELSDDSVENELERLYNDTGNSELLPDAYAPDDLTFDGKQRKATQEEKESYQARAGDAAHNRLEKLFSTSEYLKMRDDERAAAIAAIFDYARAKGKSAAGADYSDPEWLDKSEGSVEKNAAFYGILQAAKQQLDEDKRKKDAYVLQQIARRKLGDKDTEQVFRQQLGEDSGTLKMAQKFRGEGMSYQDFTRHYANLYDSKMEVPKEDQGKKAPVMMQVLKDTKSDRQAMTEFRMILGDESSTYSKIETLYKEHISLRQIVGYYNACNEDYAYNPETGKYRKRRKAEKIQWLMDTYGYSQAQAYHMYKVFAG